MRIAWFCIPASGHTHPTIEVVRRLTAAGHQVRYYSFEAYRAIIEGAGADFIPCDPWCTEMHLSPADGARIATDTAFAIKVLVDTILALDAHILPDVRDFAPDVIVADSMAMWGKLMAGKLGIPFVSSTTTFAFNRHSSKVMRQGLGDLFRLLLSMPRINRELKRLRARGYVVKGLLDVVQNDDTTDTIVYTSRQFQPRAETFSNRYRFVGPSVREVSPLPRATDRPRIYVSLGTVNNDMPGFFRACVQGLADRYEVILSLGHQVAPAVLGELPPHVTAAPWVDQLSVLADCDAFITHCGMNSVSEALWHGVPLILWPQTTEQCGVANRVAELGAGIFLADATAAGIRRAVERVLGEPAYARAAQDIKKNLRACGGAEEAAGFVVEVGSR